MDTMKRILLLALGACALAGNVKAQETVWQQIGRSLDNLGNAAMYEEARKEAKEWAEHQAALAQARSDEQKKIQELYRAQNRINEARDKAFAEDAAANPGFYHTDALPLSKDCDDIATIKLYLHDSGYSLSDEEALKVRSYLLAHRLKHVSQFANQSQ
jgi:hypothetical protein